MKRKLSMKEYILVASMLFGLFFGAGNLIFPVSMGQQAASNIWPAAIGFCVTGVGLPLLGIAAMGISESKSLFHMSSKVGQGFAYFFTCASYLTIGPFFAIPRTATVSYQVGIAPSIAEHHQAFALCIFSLLFFALVLFFSLRPSGIMTWIGKILNPIFLLFLGILIVVSFVHPMGSVSALSPVSNYADSSFFTGFLEGYNTMDAIASLAFGIILIDVIQNLGVTEAKSVSLCTIKSGFFTTIVMAAIYCAMAVMGAQSRALLGVSTDGGTALYQIAQHYFGGFGSIFFGITITFACLKTSIGLVTACSTTFAEMFPKVCSYKMCAIVFSIFSFAVSNIGLSKIIAFSLPVLLFLYPLTIVLIVLCLFGKLFHYRKCVFVATMTTTILAAMLDFVISLPTAVQKMIPFHEMCGKLLKMLPFSGISMGWMIPAVIGTLIGLVFMRGKRQK